MRSLILFLLCIPLVIYIVQSFRHPQLRLNPILDRFTQPFDQRLKYRIGQIDPQFGLDKTQVKQIADEAVNIWTQGTGKDFFVYDDNAILTINLIFDERQDSSNQRQQALQNIEQQQAAWQSKTQYLNDLKQQIEQSQMRLNVKQQIFNEELNHYNQKVAYANQNARLSAEARMQLNQEKTVIQQKLAQLQSEIDQFNQKIYELNRQVTAANQLNDMIKVNVDHFNQTFQPRQFDKGIFNGKEINVYEFASMDDLRLTIAHEFGHALGLKHNDDPQALMYYMMKDQQMKNFQLRPADLAMLNIK